MRSSIKVMFAIAAMNFVPLALTGCESNPDAVDVARLTPSTVDLEAGGGMNRTGSGSENGASASGMDRPGGGLSGSHGANSGATGTAPDKSGTAAAVGTDNSGTIGTGAMGAGGAPTPGR
jgi:hypothetical protein